MKTIGMVTLVAAHAHALQEAGLKPTHGVSLGALQDLCLPKINNKKQGWSFKGDWNKSVKPFYA